MATREQCDAALRKRLKTRADVIEFTNKWGGGHTENPGWRGPDYEATFVEENIKRIIDQAYRKELLDALGKKLDIPTDAEQARLANREAGEAAKETNVLAEESNEIAQDANRIATQSNEIARQATKRANASLWVSFLSAFAAVVSAVFAAWSYYKK